MQKHLREEAGVKFNRILFVNLDRIGDVIRSTFLFRILKKQYPYSFLTCLTLAPVDELLRNDPHIDTVMVLPHKEIRDLIKSKKTMLHMCLPVFQLLNSLKLQQFDLVINPFSEFGAMAVRYIKPKYILGRALNTKGKFLVHGRETAKFLYIMSNQKGLRSKFQYNFAAIYSRILKDINIKVKADDLYPKVYLGPHDERFAQNFLQEHTITDNDIKIGLQVGAFSNNKRWPIENFRTLAQKLQNGFNAQIIITGSSHEARTIVMDMVTGMEKKPIIAAGRTNMREAAAIISQCDLFISNDTGPMHIAATLGIPVIALFNTRQSIPEESRPWGRGHIVIAKENIEDIHVEEVFAAVKRQIQSLHVSSLCVK